MFATGNIPIDHILSPTVLATTSAHVFTVPSMTCATLSIRGNYTLSGGLLKSHSTRGWSRPSSGTRRCAPCNATCDDHVHLISHRTPWWQVAADWWDVGTDAALSPHAQSSAIANVQQWTPMQ